MSGADSGTVSTPVRVQGKVRAIIVCFFLGLGLHVGWNGMLTIGDYYYAVYPKYHTSRVLTVVYLPCAIVSMSIFAYHEEKIDTRKRNMIGFILFFLTTFGLVIGKGGIVSLLFICLMVGGFGIANACIQGGMTGDLSFMCPEFLQWFYTGAAASGVLTSALRLITKAAFEKSNNGLLLFLSISTLVEFICIFLYAYVLPKIPIIKHFRKKAASEGSKTVLKDLAAAGIQTGNDADGSEFDRLSKKQLLIQNWDYAFDLYITHVLTLSIVPGFLYENTGNHSLGTWYAVVLIALYTVWDFIGAYIPMMDCVKLESRKGLMITSLSRLVFVPCFYLTSKYANQGWMMMLVSLLALTNGYLAVCVFSVAPKGYKAPEQNALGNLLVLFLLGGIFTGVALDWLWIIGNGKF